MQYEIFENLLKREQTTVYRVAKATGISATTFTDWKNGRSVPKADKLLQFKIDDGLETRTILSGIAKHFNPDELVGKQVCFIANLPPRTLRGIVSEGMILSAEDNEGKLSLLTVAPAAKPGSEIK